MKRTKREKGRRKVQKGKRWKGEHEMGEEMRKEKKKEVEREGLRGKEKETGWKEKINEREKGRSKEY